MFRRIAVALLLLGLAGAAIGGTQLAQGKHKDWGHSGYLLPGYEYYLPDEVVSNTPGTPCGTEYLVTSISDFVDSAAASAVTNWNNSLRNNSPTNLTKYVFHWNGPDDPSPCANIRITSMSSGLHAEHCGSASAHGCVEDDLDDEEPRQVILSNRPLYAIMDEGDLADETHRVSDTAHELGHTLMFNEHYGTGYNCDSVMGHSYGSCGTTITSPTLHDRNDFYAAYKPQDSANPTSMSISSSSSVSLGWSTAQLDNITSFWWTRETDAPGSSIDYGTVSRTTSSKSFSVSNGSRWCARVNGYTTAGFPDLLAWGPSSRYGCVNRGTGPAAGGPFVATTHRTSSGSLSIRVRNYSSGSRNILVTGPSLQNIGCTEKTVASGSTYTCTSSVGQGQYSSLFWVAVIYGTQNRSYGNVDYD